MRMGEDEMMDLLPADVLLFQLLHDAVAAAGVAQKQAFGGFDDKTGVVAVGYVGVAGAKHNQAIVHWYALPL